MFINSLQNLSNTLILTIPFTDLNLRSWAHLFIIYVVFTSFVNIDVTLVNHSFFSTDRGQQGDGSFLFYFPRGADEVTLDTWRVLHRECTTLWRVWFEAEFLKLVTTWVMWNDIQVIVQDMWITIKIQLFSNYIFILFCHLVFLL
mgnify:CR=1 FL=1